MKDLNERAARVGRKPSEVPVSIFGAPGKEDTLKQFQDAGVERVVVGSPIGQQGKSIITARSVCTARAEVCVGLQQNELEARRAAASTISDNIREESHHG